MSNKVKWHRIFGLTLIDYFTGSDYHVDLEKELTEKKQYLDVLIIQKTTGKAITQFPDGLDNLAAHVVDVQIHRRTAKCVGFGRINRALRQLSQTNQSKSG